MVQNGNQFQFQVKNMYVLELNGLKMFTLHFGSKKMKNAKKKKRVCDIRTAKN
jgi:hypothetical protein